MAKEQTSSAETAYSAYLEIYEQIVSMQHVLNAGEYAGFLVLLEQSVQDMLLPMRRDHPEIMERMLKAVYTARSRKGG